MKGPAEKDRVPAVPDGPGLRADAVVVQPPGGGQKVEVGFKVAEFPNPGGRVHRVMSFLCGVTFSVMDEGGVCNRQYLKGIDFFALF